MITEDNKEFYESYFQENADYYVNQTKKFDKSGKCSFSVPAFFLGFFWMAYRKMYTHILILIGMIFAESFIEEALYEYGVISINTYEIIDFISSVVWASAIGFLANRFYISKTQKVVNRVMEEYSDREKRIQVLAKKGGTTMLGPIFIIVLIVLILMLEMYTIA